MTYMVRPVLLDFLLPDASTVEGRAYVEVTDGSTLRRDATTLLLPIRDADESTWPARVIGLPGIHVRREGYPHERRAATARWATATELSEMWRVARTAAGSLPQDPPEHAGMVIVTLEP
jgi:hypothetical protein